MNRQEFFSNLPAYSSQNRQRIQWAYTLAKSLHDGQTRDTGERYFEHVRAVATILLERGYQDADYIVLALLHDALEDTTVPLSMLEQLFGIHVALDLLALSKVYGIEDPLTGFTTHSVKKTKEEYFSMLQKRWPSAAIVVKACDRIHNLSDLLRVEEGSRWTTEKRLNQCLETRQWIIPMVGSYAPTLAFELKDLCHQIENDVLRCSK